MEFRTFFEHFKTYWDLLILLVTSYIAIYLPFTLSFHLSFDFTPRITIGWVTTVFFLDILVQYGYLRFIRKSILQNENSVKTYLQGHFILDLIAAIPWGWFTGMPIWHLLKLVKLFRVWNFMVSLRQNLIRHSNKLLLLFYGFWFLHLSHWLGCGWLALVGVNPEMNVLENYVDALYWTITTLTTVGYGDIIPVGVVQKIYTIFVQILGVGVYGLLIGNLASIISQTDPAKARYNENMEKLSALLHFQALPRDLQKRIQEYYTYLWKRRLGYDEHALLDSLPPALRSEVSVHLKQDLLEKIPLFSSASQDFIKEISGALKPQVVTPREALFKAGDPAKALFFVVQGELEVVSGDESRLLSTLATGDFFGEIALFSQDNRSATVRAKTYCDLYRLEKDDFDAVVKHFPDIAGALEEEGKKRALRDRTRDQ